MSLLHAARRLARRFGLEVHRYDPVHSHQARSMSLMCLHRVDGVFDVGANDGGYAGELRAAGFAGAILSFEPLAAAHASLARRAKDDPHWHVMPRCALGAQPGEASMHVAGNSVSSSLLPMLDAHRRAAPDSAEVGTEQVDVCRLDDMAWPAGVDARRWLLKVDTQGHELPVLQGATRTLDRCVGVQLELSLLPLYEGQALYLELIAWLEARGFDLWDVLPGFVDPAQGRMLQMDGLFFRRDAPPGPAA